MDEEITYISRRKGGSKQARTEGMNEGTNEGKNAEITSFQVHLAKFMI